MMIKRIFVLCFTLVAMSSASASFKQKIDLCLNITDNDTPFTFVGHFDSTDKFDSGQTTPAVSKGQYCIEHTYSSGPKNINISLYIPNTAVDVLFNPKAGCEYFYNNKNRPYDLKAVTQQTSQPNEKWTFTISKGAPVGMYKNVFDLECEHTY